MLGSNEGDREHLLQGAVEHIGRLAGKPEAISSIYETEAWGNTNQAPFLNQAVVIQTALQAPDLLAALLSIEDALGRKRGTRWAPRTIDIDILFYGDHIIQDFTLKIPTRKSHRADSCWSPWQNCYRRLSTRYITWI